MELRRRVDSHRPDSTGDRAGGLRPEPSPPAADPMGDRDDLERALADARTGDEVAFGRLWRELHPPLLRYLTVRGDEAPEDIAAETWLQVIRDLAGFQGGLTQFRAWLFTVARHRAIDQGRARAARPVVAVPDPAGVGAEERATPSAEQAAEERAATTAALRAVAALPPDQAELVMLRVVAGLDVATVAALVGKSPGAVRVAVHRALKTLAQDPTVRSTSEAV
ncbi:MAG: RNA polymerase sigma factor [Nocardioidaceae bacterium]